MARTKMATQKALWLPSVGAEFKLGKTEILDPGHGEALVKLEAIALNPIEWKTQQSGYSKVKEYPAILGGDGAGVVQKVGSGVTNLSRGDRVFVQTLFNNKYNTFQEYCLTDAALAGKIPHNVSIEEAATISTAFNPFAVATYAREPLGLNFTPPFEEGVASYANLPIVVMGGASSVGQYAIQLAKLSGFSPLITTASLHNKDYLVSLGATHVLERGLSAAALKEQVGQITTKPITYIFDAVSLEDTQQAAFSLLAQGGTLVVVTEPKVKRDEGSKNVLWVFGSFEVPENHALGVKFSSALTKWLAEGAIKPNKIEVLPGGLQGVASGLKRLESGVSATKLVVHPADTSDY